MGDQQSKPQQEETVDPPIRQILSDDDFKRKLRVNTADTDEESTIIAELDTGMNSPYVGSPTMLSSPRRPVQHQPACFGGVLMNKLAQDRGSVIVVTALSQSASFDTVCSPLTDEGDHQSLCDDATSEGPEHNNSLLRLDNVADDMAPPSPPPDTPPPPPQSGQDSPLTPSPQCNSHRGKVYSPDQDLPHPLTVNIIEGVSLPAPPFCASFDLETLTSWTGNACAGFADGTCAMSGLSSVQDEHDAHTEHNQRSLGDETKHAILCGRERLLEEAADFESQGDLASSKSRLMECLELSADGHIASDSSLKAEVYHKFGVIQWKSGSYDESLQLLGTSLILYEEAFSMAKSNHGDVWAVTNSPGERAESIAEVLSSIGRVNLSTGEYTEAMRSFRKSIKCLANVLPSGDDDGNIYHPAFARSATGIGMVYDARGQFDKAMEFYERGLTVQRVCLGSNHVDIALTLNSMGAIKENSSEYDQAMDCYSEALEIYRSQLGEKVVDVAVTLNNVGFIHFVWGEYNKAMKAYEDALEIMESSLGSQHRNVASTLFNIAMVHAERGSYDQALQVLKRTLKIQRSALGDNHTDVAVTLDSISDAYQHLERFDKAVKFSERSLQIRQSTLGQNHMHVGMSLVRLAKLYKSMGENELARLHFVDAKALYVLNGLASSDARMLEVNEFLAEV